MSRKIVLVTDMKDVGITEVKLRVLNNVDVRNSYLITSPIENFNHTNAMFLIRLVADSLSSGDIVIVVMDPRYENKPKQTLGIKLENGQYIFAPNNGVTSWLTQWSKIKKVVELPATEESKKHPTFNGKYKYAVAANKLLKGEKFESLGKSFSLRSYHRDEIPKGVIVHIDNYGNVKINDNSLKFEIGDSVLITADNQTYKAIFGTEFDDVKVGKLIVYNGSSLHGLPEIAINQGNAAEFLKINLGDTIDIMRAI